MNRNLLDTYLKALKLEEQAYDLSFVANLQETHLARFSFNSIGVLLEETLSLNSEAIFEKIVRRGRGGYCFEHNKLFFEVLELLGFNVRLALARVLLNQDIEAPLTHRVTILTYEDVEYFVDVGFGPLSPSAPLRLNDGGSIVQNGFTFRVVENERGDFVLERLLNEEFFTLYAFELTRYTDVDCELGHFYSYANPNAVFVKNLVVSLNENGVVHSLRNAGYRKFDANEYVDTTIANASQLSAILAEVFDIDISASESDRLWAVAMKARF